MPQEAYLHIDCVPMWLATIDTSEVKPDKRPKLERFQKEAARVLAQHFLHAPAKEQFEALVVDLLGKDAIRK